VHYMSSSDVALPNAKTVVHAMPELPNEKKKNNTVSHACFFHSTPFSIPACVSTLMASHSRRRAWVLWRH